MAAAMALGRALVLLCAAEAALEPYTQELGDSLWEQAQQAAEGLDYNQNEAYVCAAGNWGDGPQCDQWDQGRSPCWPSAMTVSASWDTELMAAWSVEMAEEFGAVDRGQLGPGVNLARFPWNGRLGEYMAGEDPYFGAEMVRAMVSAYRRVEHPPLQTVKHFIPNTIETDRQGMTEIVDERTLFEVYYPPFAAAVEAGVSGVMCSYNLVQCTSGLCSGEAAYACANDDVLNKHLKQIMGFHGIVISDWDATKCNDEAVGSGGCEEEGDYIDNAYAAAGGLDLEMPSCITFKGGVTDRAKEKAARLQWAYLVQGRQFDGGRRLQENSSRRLEEEEGFCCWWPQPPGEICSQCTNKEALSKGHCPENRLCGGAGGSAQVVTDELAEENPTQAPAAPVAEPQPVAEAEPQQVAPVPRTTAERPQVPGWPLLLGGGQCLVVAGAEAANGAALQQAACRESSALQQFSWESSLSKIRWAAHPAMCLDVEDHLFKPGSRLQLWECLEDDDDQIFDINVEPDQGPVRSHEHPTYCLEASPTGLALALCEDGQSAQSFSAGKQTSPTTWSDEAGVAQAQAAQAAATAEPAEAEARQPETTAPPALRASTTAAPAEPTPKPATPPQKEPAPAPKPATPSWHTGVYQENPFGTAAPVAPPPPSAGEQAGPGCPDEGDKNYKSECKLALADRIIAESATLLKNKGGVLPLAKSAKVALVGAEACAKDPLAQGGGSGWNGFACNEVPKVNVKDGIAGVSGVAPSCSEGAAADADVIVAVVTPAKASEGTDRGTLQLEGDDVELIRRYGGMGKKLVVVINAPGPMITSTWDAVADSILITWLPGQQNGKGIAMALYAEQHEASGRLPFTFPKCSTVACAREDELASVALGNKIANKEYRTFSEKALIGYRWYHAQGAEVSYPFGFGLFAYGSAEVEYRKVGAEIGLDSVTIKAELAHDGPKEGKEVPQLYLSFPESVPGDPESKPEWVLKGFTKVLLKPSEPQTVSFVLSLRDLSYWDDSPGMSKWVCAKGEFRACVGANARDAVAPGKAACTHFTPQCTQLVEVIAKVEEIQAGQADAVPAPRHSLAALWAALLPSAVLGGLLALARAHPGRCCWRRSDYGLAAGGCSLASSNDAHHCESSEREGLL